MCNELFTRFFTLVAADSIFDPPDVEVKSCRPLNSIHFLHVQVWLPCITAFWSGNVSPVHFLWDGRPQEEQIIGLVFLRIELLHSLHLGFGLMEVLEWEFNIGALDGICGWETFWVAVGKVGVGREEGIEQWDGHNHASFLQFWLLWPLHDRWALISQFDEAHPTGLFLRCLPHIAQFPCLGFAGL